jgi:hypothetical protein
MQLGTASGSVRAGTPSGIRVGGFLGTPPGIRIGSSFSSPSIGFRNPNFAWHHHYPRTYGYVYSYAPYYGGYAYAPYAGDYDYDDSSYTGYVGGTFDQSPYAGNPYPQQYAPSSNYYYSPSNSPPPVESTPEPQSSQRQKSSPRSQSDAANDEFAEPTVLVFRDGHRQEIANYAIMGSTLFVLSGPRSRSPVAELDIAATERANENRGVDFHVPKAQ